MESKLEAAEARCAQLQRQLDAVDAHLPPWETEPGSDVGCVGRVQTILNLRADRERCARLQQALREIEVVMTTGDEAGWRDPVGIAREALAGLDNTPAAPRTLSPDGKRRLPLGSEGQDAAHVTDVMLGRLDTPADTLMGCGHPASAVVTADEGTAYCTRCAAECAADRQEDKT